MSKSTAMSTQAVYGLFWTHSLQTTLNLPWLVRQHSPTILISFWTTEDAQPSDLWSLQHIQPSKSAWSFMFGSSGISTETDISFTAQDTEPLNSTWSFMTGSLAQCNQTYQFFGHMRHTAFKQYLILHNRFISITHSDCPISGLHKRHSLQTIFGLSAKSSLIGICFGTMQDTQPSNSTWSDMTGLSAQPSQTDQSLDFTKHTQPKRKTWSFMSYSSAISILINLWTAWDTPPLNNPVVCTIDSGKLSRQTDRSLDRTKHTQPSKTTWSFTSVSLPMSTQTDHWTAWGTHPSNNTWIFHDWFITQSSQTDQFWDCTRYAAFKQHLIPCDWFFNSSRLFQTHSNNTRSSMTGRLK